MTSFNELPPEIRLQIYRNLLTTACRLGNPHGIRLLVYCTTTSNADRNTVPATSPVLLLRVHHYCRDKFTSCCNLTPALLRVNKQIYIEARQVLYGENLFYLYWHDGCSNYSSRRSIFFARRIALPRGGPELFVPNTSSTPWNCYCRNPQARIADPLAHFAHHIGKVSASLVRNLYVSIHPHNTRWIDGGENLGVRTEGMIAATYTSLRNPAPLMPKALLEFVPKARLHFTGLRSLRLYLNRVRWKDGTYAIQEEYNCLVKSEMLAGWLRGLWEQDELHLLDWHRAGSQTNKGLTKGWHVEFPDRGDISITSYRYTKSASGSVVL